MFGHNYFGPGNPLNNGIPVDSDDRIAQVHDTEYSIANSFEDIHKSDAKAIKSFAKDFIGTLNFHSAIGAAGLGAKYITESIIGRNLYPLKMKRQNEEDDSSFKHQKSDEPSSTVEDRINKPQAGGSLPGGTGSQVVATILHNPSMKHPTIKYRKTFQIYTAGLQFEKFATATLAEGIPRLGQVFSLTEASGYVTPLAILNPDMMALFVSPAEYNAMPLWTYARNCKIKVTPLGYRLPFATNEATSTYANSQTIVQVATTVGLNTQVNLVESGYILDQQDLTNVGNLTGVGFSNRLETLYGGSGNAQIGCCMGIPRYWNNYTTIISDDFNQSASGNHNNPMLINKINIQNINDCKGTPLINYSYDYKNGLLKWDRNAFQRMVMREGAPAAWKSINFGFENTLQIMNRDTGSGAGNVDLALVAQRRLFGQLITPEYEMRVEKSHWLTRQYGQNLTADRPPLVHFGVLPVQSNAAMADKATFANVCVIWQIETELECEYSYDFTNAGTFDLNINAMDPIQLAVLQRQQTESGYTIYVSNRFPVLESDIPVPP